MEGSRMLNKIYRSLLLVSIALFALHALYIVTGMIFLESGTDDFIYRLLDIRRKLQIQLTSSLLIVVIAIGICRIIYHRIGRPDFSDKRLSVLILFGLIFLNFVAASSSAFLLEFHPDFWPHLFAHLAVVFVLQIAVVGLLLIWRANSLLLLITLVALSTYNALVLFSLILDLFLTRYLVTQVAIVCLFAILMIALFCSAGGTINRIRKINAVFLIMAIVPFVSVIYDKTSTSIPAETEAYGAIRFSEKPDIHLISVESLAPPLLAKKHMGIEKIAYEEVLSQENVHRFENAFASYVPTTPSLNSVMRLANPEFDSPSFGYFHGKEDSPVSRIFRENGRVLNNSTWMKSLPLRSVG